MTKEEQKEAEEKGYYMAKGAISCVAHILTVAAVIVFACKIFIDAFSLFTDDTDYNGWLRSGMSLHTDYKTGVQYLTTPSGGITVRIQPQTK